jgi:hypothetical protein
MRQVRGERHAPARIMANVALRQRDFLSAAIRTEGKSCGRAQ